MWLGLTNLGSQHMANQLRTIISYYVGNLNGIILMHTYIVFVFMVYFENMDVLLNLLMLKASAMPELFDRRWTCMEFIWWLKLSNADYKSSADMLLSNVQSELSNQCLIPWHEADRVYRLPTYMVITGLHTRSHS